MTIIRPNSISGINSITAKNTDQMKLYDSNGAWSHVRAGVITATKFVGPFAGSTGTFSSDVTISGDLGVAGTLTYEDVARVDAIGLSTYREGLHIGPLAGIGLTAYKDGSIRTSGIITATTYYGSGANLTGIDATQIVTGNTSVQTVDTGSDGHVKVLTEGSERLRITSDGNVGIGTNNPQCALDISKDISGGVNYVDIRNHHATGGAALRVKTQGTYGSPTYQAILGASDAGGTIRVGSVSNHPLLLLTNNTEKLRIRSNGYVDIASASDLRLTLGSQGTAGTNDSNWLRGNGASLMYNCATTSGEHTWEIGGTAYAKINTAFGMKADNTCKAWLCYRSEAGNEQIQDDFGVASVTDESTGSSLLDMHHLMVVTTLGGM